MPHLFVFCFIVFKTVILILYFLRFYSIYFGYICLFVSFVCSFIYLFIVCVGPEAVDDMVGLLAPHVAAATGREVCIFVCSCVCRDRVGQGFVV